MLIHAALAMLLWRQQNPIRISAGQSIQFVDLGGLGSMPAGGGEVTQAANASIVQTNKPVEKIAPQKKAAAHQSQPKLKVKAVITDKPVADISPSKQPKVIEKIKEKQTSGKAVEDTPTHSATNRSRQDSHAVSSAVTEDSVIGTAGSGKSSNGKRTGSEGHGTENGSGTGSSSANGVGTGGGSSAANPLKATGSIPTPPYPELAKENGESGTVILSVLVSPDGRVSNVKVVKSSRSRILDNAARRAAQKGSFQPRGWTLYTIPVSFKLD